MPISVTGISKYRDALRSGSRRVAGFTLLEVLVVVVIIGVISTAFLLSMNVAREDQAHKEAQRFTALLRLAGQEAMLRSRELAVEFVPRGYRFLVYQDQAWQALEDNILRPRELDEGLFLDVQLDGGAIDLVDTDADEQAPRILLFSTGEMTPFEVIIRPEQGDSEYHITGDAGGVLDMSERD